MVRKIEGKGWQGVDDKYHGSWQESQESFAKKFGWPKSIKPQEKRKLRAFLSHVHEDKPCVTKIYNELSVAGIDPWMDKKNLMAGQLWKNVISETIKETDAFITILSRKSVSSRGYFRKEIREALLVSENRPKGTNFIIPIKLELCNVPKKLRNRHTINYYESDGLLQLKFALAMLQGWMGLTSP